MMPLAQLSCVMTIFLVSTADADLVLCNMTRHLCIQSSAHDNCILIADLDFIFLIISIVIIFC
jgi:hypothetical protein